jgi:rhodanese-related sulfurtransferase
MTQHTPEFFDLVTEAKARIQEITPEILKTKLETPDTFVLIDVREDNEWITGHLPHAIHISKGVIERDIAQHVPDFNTNIVVYCRGGFRSALVADNLQNMGYTQVASLEFGSTGWSDAGYSLE